MMKIKNIFKSRRLKYGSLATALTAIFVVIIVMINVAATILLDRFPLTIDFTANQMFKITDQSINFVKALDKEVEIIVCAEESTFEQANIYYKQAYEVIKNYAKYSDKISVRFVDLAKNPNMSKLYPNESLSTGDIIVQSDLRYQFVKSSSLFQTEQTSSTDYSISSKAEQTMTGALMYVTDTNPTKVVLLTGLSTVDLSGYTDLLSSNNYIVEEANLMTEEINPEAKMIILPQPTADLTTDQVKKLEDFLDNDSQFGKSLVFFASETSEIGPTLKTFLNEWGMDVTSEVIADTNSSNIVNNAYIFINDVVDSDISSAMGSSGVLVTPISSAVNTLFESSDNRTTTVIAASRDTAVLIPKDIEEDFDITNAIQNSYNTIVKGTRKRSAGAELVESNVLVVGSSYLMQSYYSQNANFSNSDLMLTVSNDLADKENIVKIVPIDFSSNIITITDDQTTMWLTVIIVISVAVIVIGFVVWMRRRHL